MNKKMTYHEKNLRDIINCYGEKTGEEYDVFFDETYIGTVCGNSYGPHGCCSGVFLECETTTPLTEIAEKMGVQLITETGKAVCGCY